MNRKGREADLHKLCFWTSRGISSWEGMLNLTWFLLEDRYICQKINTPTFTWEFLQLALTYPCSCPWEFNCRGGRQVMHLHHRGWGGDRLKSPPQRERLKGLRASHKSHNNEGSWPRTGIPGGEFPLAASTPMRTRAGPALEPLPAVPPLLLLLPAASGEVNLSSGGKQTPVHISCPAFSCPLV